MTRRTALTAGLAVLGLRADPIRIAVAAGNGPFAEGVAFGLEESARAALLLGRAIETPASAPVTIVRDAAIDADGTRFLFRAAAAAYAHALAAARGGGAAAPALAATEWHHSLSRYGASELNERFAASGRRMSGEHWLGWMAAKVAVEAALRARTGEPPAAAIARLRYDGHKGRPLAFDPASRHLDQPLYVVDTERDIVIWPDV